VKLLHTSDWHVGKAIRGRSRAAEHQAVLAEIAGIAESEQVDLVVVAGDLFDTAAPTAESERIVYRALLDLAAGRRPVVVVAGNHDSAQRLAAVAPLSEASGITVVSAVRPPGDGGVLEVDADGDTALVALLPFPSQRYVVTADHLLAGDAADAHAEYADRVVRILRLLTDGFGAGTVNLVAAHLMVMGGTMGGGERGAHTVFDYWVPATAFPGTAQYVALGHLHRAQHLPGPSPLHYCGSPLQLDFGETANDPQVNVVDVRPGKPAVVTAVPLTAGSRLRTLRGTLDDVLAAAAHLLGTGGDGPAPEDGPDGASGRGDRTGGHGEEPDGDAGPVAWPDHLRVVLDESPRAGLADEVRERIPRAVEVVLAPRDGDETAARRADPGRLTRQPRDLFAEYLAEHDIADDRLVPLFDELVDEETSEVGGVEGGGLATEPQGSSGAGRSSGDGAPTIARAGAVGEAAARSVGRMG
jgi:exonuclease SbcD